MTEREKILTRVREALKTAAPLSRRQTQRAGRPRSLLQRANGCRKSVKVLRNNSRCFRKTPLN